MTNDKFAHELNSIKYARNAESMEDPTLSAIMKNVPEASMHGISDINHLPRMVAADKLDELGRDKEAALLRSTDKHVMIHKGKIVPAKFNIRQLVRNLNAVTHHVQEVTGQDFTGNVDIVDNPHGELADNPYDDDDFEEPPENLPDKHVRLVHFNPDDYHTYEHVPYHELPKRLADLVEDEANVSFDAYGMHGGEIHQFDPEIRHAASLWHSGQHSALYRIASSGRVDPEIAHDALRELNRVQPEHRDDHEYNLLHAELEALNNEYDQHREQVESRYNELLDNLRNSSVSEPIKNE